MVQMGTVINQNGQLQPAMMTMTDPNNPNMPEQLVVVQNVNGAGTLDEASAKTMINAGKACFIYLNRFISKMHLLIIMTTSNMAVDSVCVLCDS